MKKLAILVPLLCLITIVLVQPQQEVFISPTSIEAKVGDTVEFTIKVQLIHKKCPVPIENTKITVSDNLRIIGETTGDKKHTTSMLKTIKALEYKH